jgi:hypothetical protein
MSQKYSRVYSSRLEWAFPFVVKYWPWTNSCFRLAKNDFMGALSLHFSVGLMLQTIPCLASTTLVVLARVLASAI